MLLVQWAFGALMTFSMCCSIQMYLQNRESVLAAQEAGRMEPRSSRSSPPISLPHHLVGDTRVRRLQTRYVSRIRSGHRSEICAVGLFYELSLATFVRYFSRSKLGLSGSEITPSPLPAGAFFRAYSAFASSINLTCRSHVACAWCFLSEDRMAD